MICKPSTVTLIVSEPIPPDLECGLDLTVAETSVAMTAACTAVATITATIGSDVTGLTFSVSGGTLVTNGNVATVTFDTVGSYDISAAATCDGNSISDSITVNVTQGLCLIETPALTLTGATDAPLTAACLASSNVTASLQFGSGLAWAVSPVVDFTENGDVATFSFSEVGSYTVTATATGNGGESLVETHTVVVSQGQCAQNSFTATAPGVGSVGIPVSIGYSGANITGVIATGPAGVTITQSGDQFLVTAAEQGSYEITLTATHADGTTSTQVVTVQVISPEVLTGMKIQIFRRKREECS